jgi:hypothetical protein
MTLVCYGEGSLTMGYFDNKFLNKYEISFKDRFFFVICSITYKLISI